MLHLNYSVTLVLGFTLGCIVLIPACSLQLHIFILYAQTLIMQNISFDRLMPVLHIHV